MKKIFVIYVFILCISVLAFCADNKTSKKVSNMKDEEKAEEYVIFYNVEEENKQEALATEELSKDLLNAVKRKDIKLARKLISKGANVNFENEYGETPLHVAAKYRDAEMVKFLITKGANVNTETKYSQTPLGYALDELSCYSYYNGEVETEKILINNGADINIRSARLSRADDEKGLTPLEIASSIANKELIQLLLSKGAKAENIYTAAGIGDLELVKKFLPAKTKKEMGSALYYAAKNEHKDIAEYLIKQGAEITDYLIIDIMPTDNIDIIKLLIDNGANVNVKAYGTSPIKSAIRNKNLNMTKLLLNKGAQITEEDLKYTAQYGNAEIMKELFAKNRKANLDDLLSIAIENGNKDIIDFLVTKGANANTLRAAIALGNAQKVKEYLETKKVNIQEYQGTSEKSFFEQGDNSTSNGTSLLYLAAINNQVEIAKLLIISGEIVNDGKWVFSPGVRHIIADEIYYTSTLKIAAQKGYKEMVEFLISKGAKLNIEDAQGKTELDYAANDEIKNILIKAGAKKGSGFIRGRK